MELGRQKGSIQAEALTRTFGSQTAVDHIDLEIPAGKIFGFLGPNGAGKSTTVKILTTILAPSSGSATVSGLDVVRQGHKVRREIGVALQDVGVDPLMTAREMLILQAMLFGDAKPRATEKAEELLKMVGLSDVPPNKRVGQFSGGMKRRLDLALALVHDPSVLFLDEPTTGLDPVSRTAIWEEVRRLNRDLGMTIFLTTQYLEEADRLADEIAIINDGRIVTQGAPAELKCELGEEVIVLSFSEELEAQRAEEHVLRGEGRVQRDRSDLSVYLHDAAKAVPRLISRLKDHDLVPSGLNLATPTLDDVFLKATGVRIAGAGEQDAAPPEDKSQAGEPAGAGNYA